MPDEPKTDKTDTQQRIDALIKQTNDQSVQLESAAQQNAALTQQLAAVNERIAQLESRPAPDAGPDPFAAYFEAASSKRSAKPAAPTSQDFAKLVQGSIDNALKPLIEREQARTAQEDLARKQRASFEKALQLVPELADEDSDVSKAFNEVLRGNPDLQSQPDGVLYAGIMADWATKGARKEDKALHEMKAAANISRPSKGAPRETEAIATPEKAEALKNKLVEAGEQAGWNEQQQADYVGLKMLQAMQAEQGKR